METIRARGLIRRHLGRVTASELSSDAGLSLVEVLVAIVIVTIVSLAGSAVSVQGLSSSSLQERRQIAVTVASGMLEQVAAQSAAIDSRTGVSALLGGRTQAAVHTAWLANSSQSAVSASYEASDPTATASSTPVIAIGPVANPQSGTTFNVTTLLGTCYESIGSGTNNCGTISGQATAPSVTPTGMTALIRAIVIVSWTAKSCPSGGCSYVATTLMDFHANQSWRTNG